MVVKKCNNFSIIQKDSNIFIETSHQFFYLKTMNNSTRCLNNLRQNIHAIQTLDELIYLFYERNEHDQIVKQQIEMVAIKREYVGL